MWSEVGRQDEQVGSVGEFGGMAERFMAVVLKTTGLIAPGVRIPLPPLKATMPFYLEPVRVYR